MADMNGTAGQGHFRTSGQTIAGKTIDGKIQYWENCQ